MYYRTCSRNGTNAPKGPGRGEKRRGRAWRARAGGHALTGGAEVSDRGDLAETISPDLTLNKEKPGENKSLAG